MGTVQSTDEALLLSGDLEDFGRFYDRYVRALLVRPDGVPQAGLTSSATS